jgi:hypothetical protein
MVPFVSPFWEDHQCLFGEYLKPSQAWSQRFCGNHSSTSIFDMVNFDFCTQFYFCHGSDDADIDENE